MRLLASGLTAAGDGVVIAVPRSPHTGILRSEMELLEQGEPFLPSITALPPAEIFTVLTVLYTERLSILGEMLKALGYRAARGSLVHSRSRQGILSY